MHLGDWLGTSTEVLDGKTMVGARDEAVVGDGEAFELGGKPAAV